MKKFYDVAIVGGGLLGMAIAYGMAKRGRKTIVLDGDDTSARATRGNFGLVWVSGKGDRDINYARWSLESAMLWHGFCAELQAKTGIRLSHEQTGGLQLSMSESHLATNAALLKNLHAQDARLRYEVLTHAQLAKLQPEIGPQVVGATYSPHDGHVSPLYTLRALFAAYALEQGVYAPCAKVSLIAPLPQGFQLRAGAHEVKAQQVVLCAGLGNHALAPMVGLQAPVLPVRGQILVTERVKPFLRYPTLSVRQTAEGSVLLGESIENVGLDDGVTPDIVAHIARKNLAAFPLLKQVRIVRAWGALRVMTPDGMPIYEESTTQPGAFVATCHSGVTLAPAHCELLVPWMLGAPRPPLLEHFYAKRSSI